jgi:hypothetical protein
MQALSAIMSAETDAWGGIIMPDIASVRLSATGSGAAAVVSVHGTINWDDSDVSRNGVYLYVFFWGEDGGLLTGADDNRHAIFVNIVKSRTERRTGDGFELDASWDAGRRTTTFRLDVHNRRLDTADRSRRFDEDLGRDEIYARVALRDVDGGTWLTRETRTNTVRGWF